MAIAVFAAGLVASLTGADEVHVRDGVVRLADIAELPADALERFGGIVIARVPAGARQVEVQRAQLQQLAIRSIPALRLTGATEGAVIIRSDRQESVTSKCYEVAAPVEAGALISSSDVAAVPCDQNRGVTKFRWDRENRTPVATRSLEAGAYMGAIAVAEAPAVRAGQKLTLASQAGPVVIKRPVVALQNARPSDARVFVRTADGEVLSASIAEPRQ